MRALLRAPALAPIVVCVACGASPPPSPEAPPGSVDARAERAENERFARLTVDQLAYRLAQNEPVDLYDVSARERFDQGHLPGAKWLRASSLDARALPADKARALVFYCGDEQCTASREAANAALDAGYRNVSILPAGTAGWEHAGRELRRGE